MRRRSVTLLALLHGVALLCWARAGHAEHSAASPVAPVPAAREPDASAAGSLWLGDFETDRDLKHWDARGAVAIRSPEHATHGAFAAQVRFSPGSGRWFALEGYLRQGRDRRDWRSYESLHFDLYNGQADPERVILQLQDRRGRRYKEEMTIAGHSLQHLRVPLASADPYLDRSQLAQLRLVRWNASTAATLWVDSVRLEGVASPSAPSQAVQPATGSSGGASAWRMGWTSGLDKVFRDPGLFRGHDRGPMQVALARGETEAVQLVLLGGSKPAQVRASVGPIRRDDGTSSLPAEAVDIRRVDYVKTRPPYYPAPLVGEWPDPLTPTSVIEVPVGQAQPVWLAITASPALAPGRYTGTVSLADTSGRTETMELDVTIWDITLPVTPHLKSAFDFYRQRMEHAYLDFVPGGSEWKGRMEDLERRYLLDMLKHRIAPILGIDPGDPASLQAVTGYQAAGLAAFGLGRYGGSFDNNWPTEPRALDALMKWYAQAAQTLRAKGLLAHAYVYSYDEPALGDPRAAQVMHAIHQADPGLRNLLVLRESPDPVRFAAWLADADIVCLRLPSFDAASVARLATMGKEIWLYVSSPAHPFPSLVIDAPAVAVRLLPWMCWKLKATGLLYWCVNYWAKNPWEDPTGFAADQNGNGSLYYPGAHGPVSSIRLEALRDGMEDYEMLYHLQELLDAAKARGDTDPGVLQRAEQLLAIDPGLIDSPRSYSKDPDVLCAQRQLLAEMIISLQTLQDAHDSPKETLDASSTRALHASGGQR